MVNTGFLESREVYLLLFEEFELLRLPSFLLSDDFEVLEEELFEL